MGNEWLKKNHIISIPLFVDGPFVRAKCGNQMSFDIFSLSRYFPEICNK